ncbi:MAG TPA: type II toxin-antitoxin system RelE/ParE family toxin [Usitatibacter sp.]|nr:type II toxin-antitoxin system RelE/ParE family toxin [Usitatibacter sp.]
MSATAEGRDIRFTFLAVSDLRAICDAIAMPTDMWGVTASQNLARAQEFAGKFARHCALVAANPDLGTDRGDLLHNLRSSTFGKLVIFYRSRGDSVEVLRVLRASRDAALQG